MFTAAQIATIKADILANSDLNTLPAGPDGAFAVAALYNAPASPAFTVWKSSVTEADIVSKTSDEGTTWSWPAMIARTVGEQFGWSRMVGVMGIINPSLPQVRQAIQDIFSNGPTGAAAQRTHLAAMGKRSATRLEKLLATGTGSTAVPATMGYEGAISYTDIQTARGN